MPSPSGADVERAPALPRPRAEAAELGVGAVVERVVQHQRALRRQLRDPGAEELVQVVERREVIVVVELGVEHDRRARPQAGERAVRLVGLGHHVPSRAHARIDAELRHVRRPPGTSDPRRTP